MTEPTFTDLTKIARKTRVPKRELVRLVNRVVQFYDPLRFYLFGSFAWGEPHWKSDLDFCVIVATDEEVVYNKAMDAIEGFEQKDTDFVIITKSRFEKTLSNPASKEHKIYYEGAMLYTKPDLVFEENHSLVRIEGLMLEEAYDQLTASKRMMIDPPLPKISLFHTQQCIEESLKAYRAFHLQGMYKTHRLNQLRSMCIKLDSDFANLDYFQGRDARRIAEYYWLRYDREVPMPETLAGIQEEISVAERIYQFVKHKIETMEPPTEPTVVPDGETQQD